MQPGDGVSSGGTESESSSDSDPDYDMDKVCFWIIVGEGINNCSPPALYYSIVGNFRGIKFSG